IFGNSDAIWPSVPIPSQQRSKCGGTRAGKSGRICAPVPPKCSRSRRRLLAEWSSGTWRSSVRMNWRLCQSISRFASSANIGPGVLPPGTATWRRTPPASVFSMNSAMAELPAFSAQRMCAAASFMPAYSVSFGDGDSGARPPTPGAVRFDADIFFRPDPPDRVDPVPLRFHLVAADEKRRFAMDQVEKQSLIGNPSARLCKSLGKREVERNFAQRDLVAVQTRLFRHYHQSHIFLRLQANNQPIRRQHAAAGGKDIVRHTFELDHDLAAPFGHALARTQVKGHALPAPIVDMGAQGDKGFGIRGLAEIIDVGGNHLAIYRAA